MSANTTTFTTLFLSMIVGLGCDADELYESNFELNDDPGEDVEQPLIGEDGGPITHTPLAGPGPMSAEDEQHELEGSALNEEIAAPSVPPVAVVSCTGDNDWSGSTACFREVHHSGWSFASGSGWSYYYDDVRYTSNKSAEGLYEWTAPKSGLAKFYVWIPGNKATADVRYSWGCHVAIETYPGGERVVDQRSYSGVWFYLGSVESKAGWECTLGVHKASNAGATELMAMDGVRVDFS